ncbi:ABC transporter ATP-binding protein [Solitalea lacus]|uniref:ABC transporter ATP-binding protein n=1 Tax=Solitalea lacus TaxID=2911172 RepID=UPI001EDC12FC|nr:ATP-binding cassette domain-containing protein [Solitalea lacus]UKJ09339.1 ATP-binding cassette domain-containing protein [Solitalea lacus]
MLSIRNIVKQYANHTALSGVSLEIEQGSVFGLLGPNGAGKTSLIRIINQITAPDSGEIFFKGEKLSQKHIAQIGYLPEERGLYKKMEIGEQVLYLAQLKDLSRADALKRARYWFEKLEIQSWWHKKVEELSKGMQQKVQFVTTVMHQPELLILDEPFSGFDPINVDIITREILELNKLGTTIIFSTHRMESVEALCDSIALLNKSQKILEGKVKEIRYQYRSHSFKITYNGNLPYLNGSANQIYDILTHSFDDMHQHLTVKLKGEHTSNDLLRFLMPHVLVEGLEEIIPSMHDIFIAKVKETGGILPEELQ